MLPVCESPRPSSVGSITSTQSGTSVSNKSHQRARHNDICVGEELKIAVDIAMERFRLSEEHKELEFPSSFTSTERAYIHRLCQSFGLKSKSKGKGANRYLTIAKKEGAHTLQSSASFTLAKTSRHQIMTLMQRSPVTHKERLDLQPRTERGQYNEGLNRELNKTTTTGRLGNGVPQVPPAHAQSDLQAFRASLPVYQMREKITKAINDHKVVLISGETGSGKTTQVPQMILDDCRASKRPCRIFCTQPRRLAALTVAERVAAERGEKIGQTVGYQIRLESKSSPKTLLTFCTNGVLLRTLMGAEGALTMVTHVIVDEIHERDRFSDFLLIVLRDLLPRHKNFRVILMSAALNVELFSAYFHGCPVISVPGKLFEVQEYFLEDILKWTNYTNKDMEKYQSELSKVALQQRQLDDWCNLDIEKVEEKPSDVSEPIMRSDCRQVEMGEEREDLEPWLIKKVDSLLSDAWLHGHEDAFPQIFHLVTTENVSVDYLHSETGASALMIAAGRGFFEVVEQLVTLGANVNLQASNDWTALDWARRFQRADIVELLEAYIAVTEVMCQEETRLVRESPSLSPADRRLLSIYHHSFDDEKVDLNLILVLLLKLHSDSTEGAVLVFLPGYDEIVTLRDRILEDRAFIDSNRYILYTLHSSMQSVDQRKVFRSPPPGVRKIILSTNISETSITINDVVAVIDSGRVKEKSFDALTSVSLLKSYWISRASALQRKGRAGRTQPGVCYHLFSRVRHDSMQDYQQAEILRYPLQELCLHTKLLAPPNCTIADFLARAAEPPAFLITRNAVHLLKQIDALDPFEELTELGGHLTDLPVEPRYGKMVLYAVVLKCLDPVLTIACALAYKDPFLLPARPFQKRSAMMARRKFSAGTFSDHMTLLRAFQMWQKAKTEGWERSFCEKNFIAAATMEMIFGMRTQLLGQLRASGFVRARGGGDIRDLNTHSENWAVVKAALCAGTYPNLMRVDHKRLQLVTAKESRVRFHSSSTIGPPPTVVGGSAVADAIRRLPTDWLIYEEMTRSHRLAQVKCCTAVAPLTVAIFAGPAKLPYEVVKEAEGADRGCQGDGFLEASSDSEGDDREDGKRANLRLDDWIAFRVDSEAANLTMQLRQKWHSLFLRRMRAPSKPWSQVDENVIRAVISVLTNEEQSLGLQQPAGIGQRPRPMSTESMICSGGNRRGTQDADHVDAEGTVAPPGRQTPTRGRPFKFQGASPRKKEFSRCLRGTDDKGEGSGARSSSSLSNSSSLLGSAAVSPCSSPQPATGGAAKCVESEATCRYFVMRSSSPRAVELSQTRALWAATPAVSKKLFKAFKAGRTVYLVFCVQGASHFQGYAKMRSTTTEGAERPKEFSASEDVFMVDWIKRATLPFQQTQHLTNPWSDGKKIQSCRDGQELEPGVGEALLKLWHPASAAPAAAPATRPPYTPEVDKLARGVDVLWSSAPLQGRRQWGGGGEEGRWGRAPGSYRDGRNPPPQQGAGGGERRGMAANGGKS